MLLLSEVSVTSVLASTLPITYCAPVGVPAGMVTIVVPLLVLLVPLFNHLPQFLRWRIRRRIFRWYGELVLLERAIEAHAGEPRFAQWQQSLDRIERAVANIRTPASYASEVYQLRTHVALVRRTLDARIAAG